MTSDFTVNNVRIEYFGLIGHNQYDRIVEKKKTLCKKLKLKLVELYPQDFFSKNFKEYLINSINEAITQK